MTSELDPLAELRFLTEALRAHAEWQQACGASALPAAVAESRQPSVVSHQSREASSLASPVREAVRAEQSEPPRERTPSSAATPKPTADNSQLTADERRARLTVLADEVKACTKCILHEARTQTVFARGNGSSGLCFVGEGPGAEEDEQGLPFVGAAGQLLDKMIAAMGIERDDVYVCNIVKCRPPKNRTPETEEMNACMPYLVEQLSLIQPQVIVALGKTAVQGLFGTAEGITRIRGRWRLYQGRIAVMPTFHPAYLLRNPAAKREVWADLQLVLKHMGRSLPVKGA
jgi:uracil-DNA glycosylase family 4